MTQSSVAVLTPSLPERSLLLDEARASVVAQTIGVEHLVGVDVSREGSAIIRNRLAADTHADWFLLLDDDDVLDTDYVETLLPHLEDADVVYPWCRVEGSRWSPNRLYRKGALAKGNFIPVTAMIRRSMWESLDGLRPSKGYEDWDLWRRAEAAGARFVCVPEVLWTYRIHGGNTLNNFTS